MEKQLCFPRIKRQNDKTLKKVTDESETDFNFGKERHKQAF